VLHRLNSAVTLIQRTTTEAPRLHMYYIGLDVHKKTISYCVKDVNCRIQQEGKVGSTRRPQGFIPEMFLPTLRRTGVCQSGHTDQITRCEVFPMDLPGRHAGWE